MPIFIEANNCRKGTYNLDDNCTVCPKGKYSDEMHSESCHTCPIGRFNMDDATDSELHNDLNDCIICSAGRYNDMDATHVENHDSIMDCKFCSMGKYLEDDSKVQKNHDNENDCQLCSRGRFSDQEGLAYACECQKCSPGFYADNYGSTSCIQCGIGTYQSDSGKYQCNVCHEESIGVNDERTRCLFEEGQVCMILEAMKMQNEINAPTSGTVSEINCSPGSSVEANMPLIVIKPDEKDE